jgi:hypothetical protein
LDALRFAIRNVFGAEVWLLAPALLLGCGDRSVPNVAPADVNPDGGSIAVPTSTACAEGAAGAPGLEPDPLCTDGLPEVSYANDVASLVGCSGEACHIPWRYESLVDQRSSACCDHRFIVAPGHPSQSHLYQAVTGTSDCVGRMGELDAAQIEQIVAWICEGAPHN